MKKTILVTSLIVSLLTLVSCGKETIASRATKKGLDIGTAFASDIFDPEGQERIKEFSNILVAENFMKCANLRPNAKFWNWSDIDHSIEFAEKNNIQMKFHTMFWHQQNSSFINNMKSKEEALEMMDNHIITIMDHLKGKIKVYDVVNEMFEEDGSFRKTIWYNLIGEEYLAHALTVASEHNSGAKLYLNEYNNECVGYPKADAMYNFVKSLKEKGVPIDGVGMQLHLSTDLPFDPDAIRANCKRYADIGIEISFSEVDVRLPASKFKDPEEIKKQEYIYTTLLDIALTEPNVKSFIVWGMYDRTSWVPATFGGYGNACIYDVEYNKKPVYEAMFEKLK